MTEMDVQHPEIGVQHPEIGVQLPPKPVFNFLRKTQVPKLLNGEQEAHIIALRLGPPPKGYANWSLRLLARRVVELAIIESISHETIRRTLKKTG